MQYAYIGKGSIYGRVKGSAAAKRRFGNCSKLTLDVSEERKTMPDYESAGGGIAASARRVTDVQASMTLHELSPENLAMALYGEVAAVTAASVTDEPHTAYVGGLIRFTTVPDRAETVTVTDDAGTTTYTEGTDYKRVNSGIEILAGGAIVDGASILVDYTKAAGSIIQALLNSAQDYELTFDGLNEARSGKPVVIDIHCLKLGVLNTLDAIGDEFAGMEIPGDVLKDESVIGTGLSQYFKVEMVS